jgi:hypothetical protein
VKIRTSLITTKKINISLVSASVKHRIISRKISILKSLGKFVTAYHQTLSRTATATEKRKTVMYDVVSIFRTDTVVQPLLSTIFCQRKPPIKMSGTINNACQRILCSTARTIPEFHDSWHTSRTSQSQLFLIQKCGILTVLSLLKDDVLTQRLAKRSPSTFAMPPAI